MPRGQNPNSKKALAKNRKKTQFSGERARELGARGLESQRTMKSFKECFRGRMDDEMMNDLFDMLFRRAKNGNLKAFEILRDTMGEKPTEHVEAEVYEDDGLIDALTQGTNRLIDDNDMVGDDDG